MSNPSRRIFGGCASPGSPRFTAWRPVPAAIRF